MPFWLPLATTSRSCLTGSETVCACSPHCSWRLCRDPRTFPRHTLPEDLNVKTVATDNPARHNENSVLHGRLNRFLALGQNFCFARFGIKWVPILTSASATSAASWRVAFRFASPSLRMGAMISPVTA